MRTKRATNGTYKFTFQGSLIGSIGINTQWFSVRIDAISEEQARAKLYDTHQHISNLRLVT